MDVYVQVRVLSSMVPLDGCDSDIRYQGNQGVRSRAGFSWFQVLGKITVFIPGSVRIDQSLKIPGPVTKDYMISTGLTFFFDGANYFFRNGNLNGWV